MAEDQLFYVGQKVLIEKDGKFLVLFDPLLGSDLPGGKIQQGETDFITSLLREVQEETGLEISIGRPFFTNYFEVPKEVDGVVHRNAGKKIYTVVYSALYVGREINLSEEHNRYEWVDASNYQEVLKGEEHMTTYKALEVHYSNRK
jgi:8-oxo-dGTP pyrophosphatase MutT (NUDIX family)